MDLVPISSSNITEGEYFFLPLFMNCHPIGKFYTVYSTIDKINLIDLNNWNLIDSQDYSDWNHLSPVPPSKLCPVIQIRNRDMILFWCQKKTKKNTMH